MKADIIEKGEGTVTVLFRAENPPEAMTLALVKMERNVGASLSTFSAGQAPSVQLGSVSVPMITEMHTLKPVGPEEWR